MSGMTVPSTTKSTYRFALYGRRESGKTCFLAALAMDRDRHPQGFTCQWNNTETDCPKPLAEDERSKELDDPAVARYEGKGWLQKAVDALKAGEVPQANPIQAAPYRYLFEFGETSDYPGTQSLNRTYTVELIDYSGELINSDLSERDLAKKLRQHLTDADGILVLAEAPRKDEDWSNQHPELTKLKTAFRLIRKANTPVALLINKWDRLADAYTLNQFLNLEDDNGSGEQIPRATSPVEDNSPQPAHIQLFDSLRIAVGKSNGKSNFRAFAASALGKCVVKPDIDPNTKERILHEVPERVLPLRSIGVEDPFFWMLRRHDELIIEQINEQMQRLDNRKIWQLVTGAQWSLNRLIRRARGFVVDVPGWKAEIEQASLRSRSTQAFQAAVFGSIMCLCLFFMIQYNVAIQDTAHIKELAVSARADLPSPGALHKEELEPLKTRIDSLNAGKNWLLAYQQGSLWRFASRAMQTARTVDINQLIKDVEEKKEVATKRYQMLGQLIELDQAACSPQLTWDSLPKIKGDLDQWIAEAPLELSVWSDQVRQSIQTGEDRLKTEEIAAFLKALLKLVDEAGKAESIAMLKTLKGSLDTHKEKMAKYQDDPKLFATAEEAARTIDFRVDLIGSNEIEEKLDALNKAAQELLTSDELKRVADLKDQYAKLLQPERNTPKLKSKMKELEAQLEQAKNRVKDVQLARSLSDDFDKASLDRDIVGMAQLLTRDATGPQTKKRRAELTARFKNSVTDILQAKVDDKVRKSEWTAAYSIFDDTCKSLEVRSILGDDLDILKSYLDTWILRPEDKYLYAKCCAQSTNVVVLAEYLEKSKKKRMKRFVEDRLKFEKRRNEKWTFRIQVRSVQVQASQDGRKDYEQKAVRIYVGNDKGTTNYVQTNDTKILYDNPLTFDDSDNNPAELPPMGLDEIAVLTLEAFSPNASNSFGHRNLCKSTHRFRLEDLAKGVENEAITPLNDSKPRVFVSLRLIDYPSIPELPPYDG